jgi:magnesium chelatase accessory protein
MTNLRAASWDVEGRDWPNRQTSRFVEVQGLRWHVQEGGSGPSCLLLHGTGAATHSWRGVLPLLMQHFHVLAPDLPGHGFTARPSSDQGLSLPGMAQGVADLLRARHFVPEIVIGHSAGAAVLCRMCLDGKIDPVLLVSLNGALLPLSGLKHPAFTPLVRGIFSSDWVSRWFSKRLDSPAAVEQMLAGTGSRLDARGLELYRRLSTCSAHTGAALTMMAVWDPRPLQLELPKLRCPLLLVVGALDRMILPGEAAKVARLVPRAQVEQLPGLGHLAHEEAPDKVAELIIRHAQQQGILLSSSA